MTDERNDEYLDRVNRVMDFIDHHLAEPLTLEQLAAIACFSPFHFHRVFVAMMGETLKQFVQRLRLERAAGQLLYRPKASITEIALDSGFASSSTFARAFKSHFGLSASEWRAGGPKSESKLSTSDRKIGKTLRKRCEVFQVSLPYLDPITHTMHWRVEMKKQTNTLTAEVEVKEFPEMPVAYLRHVGPYAGDEALFERLWGQLLSWAGPRGLFQPPETQMLTLYHDDPGITDDEKLRMSICITVPEGTATEGAIGSMTVPGGAYAVANFEIDVDQYGDAWNAVYGGWLPKSGYQPDDRAAFELCLGDPKEHPEGKHTVAICVPVKPL